MLRDEGVELVKQQLAYRRVGDADIVKYMKLAQVTLERAPTKPWFLVSEDSFATLTVGEERVALPGNFLQEVEDATFKWRPSDFPTTKERDLIKEEYDLLRSNFKEEASGPPEAYALLGNYLRVFPLPDAAHQVRLIYYKQDVVLDTNVENQWLKYVPLLLIGAAGQMMSTPVRDKTAYEVFGQWVALGTKLLHNQDVAREMANRQMQIGGPSV